MHLKKGSAAQWPNVIVRRMPADRRSRFDFSSIFRFVMKMNKKETKIPSGNEQKNRGKLSKRKGKLFGMKQN